LKSLPADGRDLFSKWLAEAESADGMSARVMAVATSDPEDGPRVRSVIFHTMHADGGLVFGTNASSQKARALRADPRVELHFRWGDRQIRVRGMARIEGATAESDAAFARLPRHCQLGLTCVVDQGKNIGEEEHASTIEAYTEVASELGPEDYRKKSQPVLRPAHYTAIVVAPETFEFYQGGQPGYINDRFLFGRDSESGAFPLITRLMA